MSVGVEVWRGTSGLSVLHLVRVVHKKVQLYASVLAVSYPIVANC